MILGAKLTMPKCVEKISGSFGIFDFHAAMGFANSQFQLCEFPGFIRKPGKLVMIMVMMELVIMIFMSCESQLSN